MKYDIQTSTNMQDWTITGTVTNATGTVEFTNPIPADATELYYRAKLCRKCYELF